MQNTIVNLVASIVLLLFLLHCLLSIVGLKKVIPNILKGLVTGIFNGIIWLISQAARLIGRGIGAFFRELFRGARNRPPPRP